MDYHYQSFATTHTGVETPRKRCDIREGRYSHAADDTWSCDK